jgi:predicted lipid-binding transport protein (Tim44 family)
MGVGKLPVDLILFGMIALLLILRLRSILGRRQGFEAVPEMLARRGAGPVIEGRAERVPAAPARAMPDATSETGLVLTAMRALDKSFAPATFLAGAESAFRMIVTAYAAGERDKLRPLLTPDTYAAFEQAITAREALGQTQRTELRSILEAGIEHASLMGSLATITVRFVSHQIALTLGADGTIVTGADAVTELADVWTFQRDLKQSGTVWRLAEAHSA